MASKKFPFNSSNNSWKRDIGGLLYTIQVKYNPLLNHDPEPIKFDKSYKEDLISLFKSNFSKLEAYLCAIEKNEINEKQQQQQQQQQQPTESFWIKIFLEFFGEKLKFDEVKVIADNIFPTSDPVNENDIRPWSDLNIERVKSKKSTLINFSKEDTDLFTNIHPTWLSSNYRKKRRFEETREFDRAKKKRRSKEFQRSSSNNSGGRDVCGRLYKIQVKFDPLLNNDPEPLKLDKSFKRNLIREFPEVDYYLCAIEKIKNPETKPTTETLWIKIFLGFQKPMKKKKVEEMAEYNFPTRPDSPWSRLTVDRPCSKKEVLVNFSMKDMDLITNVDRDNLSFNYRLKCWAQETSRFDNSDPFVVQHRFDYEFLKAYFRDAKRPKTIPSDLKRMERANLK